MNTTTPRASNRSQPVVGRLALMTLRFLSSLKLAVTLLCVLAAVLAAATIVETEHGATYAHWYVYESGWFLALLALLGTNIFCAAAIRFPWQRHQTGFVVTHCGLLVLLAGSMQTFVGGIEGEVSLVEGETTRQAVLHRYGQITAFWIGRSDEPPYEFTFDPGPVDWPAGKSLEIGEVQGVAAVVRGYLRQPRPVEQWSRDDSRIGGPVVKFKVTGQDGKLVSDGWLVDRQYGDAVFIGPLRLQLERAASDHMLADFVRPPVADLGPRGLLAMYCGDQVRHVPVDEIPSAKIAFAESGITVEIAEYLPHASPDRLGRFVSKSDAPKNPMVELQVQIAGNDEPLRQIAFAKDPLLNLDGVYGRDCPVKFRYFHPAVMPPTAFEMLQTTDGKLHGRLTADGSHSSLGELTPGQQFKLPGGYQLEILDYLPSARRELTFVVDESTTVRKGRQLAEPAALVELHVQGQPHRVWLRRNDPTHGRQTLNTPSGALAVEFGDGRVPLGFALELLKFRRDTNPGNAGNAGFSSQVRVSEGLNGPQHEHTISMNEPLHQGKFTLYQSGFGEAGHDKLRSDFRLAHDPGRITKYSGCLLVCLGIAIMFYMRAYFGRPRSPSGNAGAEVPASRDHSDDVDEGAVEEGATQRTPHRLAILVAVCCLQFATPSVRADDAINWDNWRTVPVQNGGRHKPLDTLAWEALRMVGNRGSQVDPVTAQRLSPTAWYVTSLMEWRGWDHPDQAQLQVVTDWRPLYFHLHEADKWDQLPLLRVDYPPLRTLLGVPEGNHVSPQRLAGHRIMDRRTERELSFTTWADALLVAKEAGEELTEFEQKGLELAERLWSYQNHRMGRTLEVLPIEGDPDRKWAPLAYVLLTSFDDSLDPTGDFREIQRLWRAATVALREHDAVVFNRLAEQFVATLRRIGGTSRDYPPHRDMALEAAYNRWVPFRWGWSLMLLACGGMVLHAMTRRTASYRIGLVAYGAALVAVVVGFAIRMTIAGRPPVTNMYESVIYVGGGVALLGAILELLDRRGLLLPAAAAVAAAALGLADACPLILDASLRPLEPVLRSNFWLTTHVLTITLSYAAFALAFGLANITLGFYTANAPDHRAIGPLSRLTYRTIQIGVLLLAAGIFLGGVWADYSWGRFWGWDPKEVWALVALLGYVAVLHARFAGWVGQRGLAALCVGCFALVVMAWYGVNFVLGAGLHSYGFGGGGQIYVYGAVIAQFLFAAAALARSAEAAAAGS